MKKPIKTALLRDLEIQLSKEEISYSRMVEILNEKAVEYARECSQASLEKASMSVINERLETMKTNKIKNNFHMKYKLTKLKDDKFNGKHPNFIDEGYWETGHQISELEVGERFLIQGWGGYLNTSVVTEILEETEEYTIFKTVNSTYKLELTDKNIRTNGNNLQKLVVEINSAKITQDEYWDEQEFPQNIQSELDKLETVACGLDVDKHRWYETSITVYKHPEGFFGIRYVTDTFSEMDTIEDIYWTLTAFEMEQVLEPTYKVKKDKWKKL